MILKQYEPQIVVNLRPVVRGRIIRRRVVRRRHGGVVANEWDPPECHARDARFGAGCIRTDRGRVFPVEPLIARHQDHRAEGSRGNLSATFLLFEAHVSFMALFVGNIRVIKSADGHFL